jgi:hypothetical protein
MSMVVSVEIEYNQERDDSTGLWALYGIRLTWTCVGTLCDYQRLYLVCCLNA